MDFSQYQSTCLVVLCCWVRLLFQVNLSLFPFSLFKVPIQCQFLLATKNFRITSMMTGYCLGRMDNAINHSVVASCDFQVTTTAFHPSHICNIWTSMSPCSACPWAALVGLTVSIIPTVPYEALK